MNNKSKQKGMSLIEIMITLAIASILLAYAVPNFRDFWLRQSMDNKMNDMLADFMFAKTEAINRGVPVKITANGTWDQGWQVAVRSTGEVLRESNIADANLTMTDPDDDKPVVFSGTGSLVSGSVARTITVKHSSLSYSKELSIGMSGTTSVQ